MVRLTPIVDRVQRLCSTYEIWSVLAKKRGFGRKTGPPVHGDLVLRDFTAEDLDLLWFTDLTEHPTGESKLYLCALKDACSTRIVGYCMSPRMTARLATAALRNAIAFRDPKGTVVVHSDRGSQCGSRDFIRPLRDAGLQGSMGRVGACGDNAAMESIFVVWEKLSHTKQCLE